MTWTSPGWWITSRSLVFCRVPAASRRQSWQLSTSGPKGPGRRLRRRVPVNPGRRAGDAAREAAAGRAWRRATGDLPPRIPPEACWEPPQAPLRPRASPQAPPTPVHESPWPRKMPLGPPAPAWPRGFASKWVGSRLLRGPERHGYSGGIFLRRLWAKNLAVDMLKYVSRSF